MTEHRAALEARFDRAQQNPPLMMLYPPVATGEPWDGSLRPADLWRDTPGTGTLYVHIPFCHERCPFCPFYATAGDCGRYEEYLDTVLAEADLYADAVSHISFTSVYLGGGTPSVLPPASVGRLLEGLGTRLHTDGADVTIEVNPATVTPESLDELQRAGVTRLSLGIQSFEPAVLRAIGRSDTVDRVRHTLEAALALPFRDVNIDLMYGLPDQDRSVWKRDLETAADYGVPGLTLYATVYLPSFRADAEAEGRSIASDSERRAMYETAFDLLNERDYPQPHFGAGAFLRRDLNPHRRNLAAGLPTLGLGTWAYSSPGRLAYHNTFPREEWAATVARGDSPIRQVVRVPEEEAPRKYVIEALLLAYLDLEHFRNTFGDDLATVFPDEVAVLEGRELIRRNGTELRLTRTGGHHLREIRYLFASDGVADTLESGRAAGL